MSPLSTAYRELGPRDRRLDYLRGLALLVMAINHAGLESSLPRRVTGGGDYFVNAAEAFFFVSGVTLGLIAIGRPIGRTIERLLHRTGTVYIAAVGIALGFSVLSLATPIDLWGGAGEIAGREILSHLAGILTLHIGVSGSEILITYVLFFAAAPLVLWALHQGRTAAVVIATAALSVVHQLEPACTTIFPVDGRNPAANAPIFYGGVVLGWHRHAIASWMRTPLGRIVDGVAVCGAVALLHLYATRFSWWPELDAALGTPRRIVRETTMPPLALAFVALHLRVAWLLVTALWVPLVRTTGWLVLRLGRASLFTYGVHLVAMVVLFNTPGFRQDHNWPVATLLMVYYVAMIFGAVCVRDRIRAAAPNWSPRARHLLARTPIGAVALLVMLCTLLALVSAAPRATDPTPNLATAAP